MAYTINKELGQFIEAEQIDSPNQDDRPDGCEPDLIVIHSISLPPAEYGADWVERFFTNDLPAAEHPYFAEIAELRVSAHLYIRRDGSLVQFVPLHRRAWHAGESSYCGRERCNDFSIGIELEGTDTDGFEPAQYDTLTGIIESLIDSYGSLSADRITGHSDIAPGRKTDPGSGFDWALLQQRIS